MKTIYFHIFLFIFTSVCLDLHAQSLEDYLQKAAANNPGLQSRLDEHRAALEKIPQAGGLPDPQASFGYFISPVETRVGSRIFDVSLSQSFPWFGTLSAKKSEATQWAAVSHQDFLAHKNDLFFRVRNLYYRLWLTDTSAAVYRQYLRLLDAREQTALRQVETAGNSLADVLRVQMERKETAVKLEWLLDNRKTLEAEMNRLLNQSPETPLAVDTSLALLSLDTVDTGKSALLDSVRANHPALGALRKRQLAYEQQKKVARKSGMPSFGIGANYGIISQRTDMSMPDNGKDAFMSMVSISIPLYRGKYRGMAKESEYRLQAAGNKLADAEHALAAELTAALNQYRDAGRRTDLYGDLLRQAGETLEILTTAYMGAKKDYEEVLRMEQQLLKYQLELEQARVDQNMAVALVEKLVAKDIEAKNLEATKSGAKNPE